MGGILWVNSTGGPLVVLDRGWLGHWGGVESRSAASGPPTDYDRALALVREPVAAIRVGPGQGAVLGDEEPFQTAWYRPVGPDDAAGVLVRWRYAESEGEVASRLAALPAGARWRESGVRLPSPTGDLVLFDSSAAGSKLRFERVHGIYEALSIAVAPGTYAFETAEYRPDPLTWLTLHRLVPL
jgi:hypothetical protein